MFIYHLYVTLNTNVRNHHSIRHCIILCAYTSCQRGVAHKALEKFSESSDQSGDRVEPLLKHNPQRFVLFPIKYALIGL